MKNQSNKKQSFLIHTVLRHSRFSKVNLAVFVIVFAAIGGYILLSSHAASFTANVFVSPNGSDMGTNCKLFSSPVINPDPSGTSDCATFDKANILAQAGQTVGVLPGRYGTQAIMYHTGVHIPSDGTCMISPTGSRWSDVSDYSGCVTFEPTTGNRSDVIIDGTLPMPGKTFKGGLSVFTPGVRIKNITIETGGLSAAFMNQPSGDACKYGGSTAPLEAQPHDIVFDGIRDYTPGGLAANFDYHGLPNHPGEGAYFTTGIYNVALINSEWGPVYDNDGGWQIATITPDDTNYANYATYCRSPFTNHQLYTRNIYINHLNFHDLIATCTSNLSPPLPCPSGNLNHMTGIHWGASDTWLMNSKFTNIAQQDVEVDILSGSGGDDPSLAEKNNVIIGNVFGDPCATPNPALFPGGDTSTCHPINGGGSVNLANNSSQGLYLNNIVAFNSFFGNYSFLKENDTIPDWFRGSVVLGNIANMGTTPSPCSGLLASGVTWKYNANFSSTPDLCDPTDIALPTSPYADPNNPNSFDFTPTKTDVTNLVPVSDTGLGSGGLSIACPAVDIDGNPRPLPGKTNCAAGAYEESPPANVWVSTAGNDTTCARGDPTKPCASFDKAYQIANPGDTVTVLGGTYPHQIISSSKAGISNPITFQPCAGCSVTIKGLDISSPYITMDNITSYPGDGHETQRSEPYSALGILVTASNVTLNNVVSKGAYVWNMFLNADNVTWNGGEVGTPGVVGYRDCLTGDYDGQPLSILGGSNITLNKVHFHVFAANHSGPCTNGNVSYNGMHMEAVRIDSANNVKIQNSIFDDQKCSSDIPISGCGDPSNTIFISNNHTGAWPVGLTFQNNFFGTDINPTFNGSIPDCSGYVWAYNTHHGGTGDECLSNGTWIGNLATRPSYYSCVGTHIKNVWEDWGPYTCGSDTVIVGSRASIDKLGIGGSDGFHLLSGSPAIDAAETSYCTTTLGASDIDGNSRPQGPACDAGADEYTASYTPPSNPLPPSGNPSPTSNPDAQVRVTKKGDCNGDNIVNLTDLSILLSHYGTNYFPAEFAGGSSVGLSDLSILLSNYGK